jgi:hypothetical protein
MLQATVSDGGKLDAFAFCEDRLRSAEVDVSRREVVDALMIADVIVVLDEGGDLPFERAGNSCRAECDSSGSGASARSFPASEGDTERRGHAACPCLRAIWRDRPRRNSIRCRLEAGAVA